MRPARHRDGLSLLTWRQDSFAYADAYDEAAGRYRGLRCGQLVTIAEVGLLVKPELALRQQEKEAPPPGPESADERRGEPDRDRGPQPPLEERVPRRFHGTVALAEGRAGLEASRIAEEVLSHLVGLVGAKVSVTLEIDAEVPDGVPKNVVRVVIENCRTLKFKNYSFEGE
jgi:hypothetical protein